MSTVINPISKRLFDIVVAGTLLILSAPFMLLIALCVVFAYQYNPIFTQRRTGLAGVEFTMYKFRTMKESLPDGPLDKPLYVKREDARVTKFGRILRDTSLDELPQLLNVLKGDMSLVGPRPQPLNHLNYYGNILPHYRDKLRMRPGITGLVQVTPLRYETSDLDKISARARCDSYYIAHWSLILDIKILWKTILLLLNPATVLKQTLYYAPRHISTSSPDYLKEIEKFNI